MGIPLRRGRDLRSERLAHGAAGGRHQRNDGAQAVGRSRIRSASTCARARTPTGAWTTIVGVDRRHPSRRPRGSAAAGVVHHLSAGTAGGAVHRAADNRRSGADGGDRPRRGAAHRQEPAALRHAHDDDAAIGSGVDAPLHAADRRRLRRARARPRGDRRLRRDVADRQRAHARGRRAAGARRGAVAVAEDDRRAGREAGRPSAS